MTQHGAPSASQGRPAPPQWPGGPAPLSRRRLFTGASALQVSSRAASSAGRQTAAPRPVGVVRSRPLATRFIWLLGGQSQRRSLLAGGGGPAGVVHGL